MNPTSDEIETVTVLYWYCPSSAVTFTLDSTYSTIYTKKRMWIPWMSKHPNILEYTSDSQPTGSLHCTMYFRVPALRLNLWKWVHCLSSSLRTNCTVLGQMHATTNQPTAAHHASPTWRVSSTKVFKINIYHYIQSTRLHRTPSKTCDNVIILDFTIVDYKRCMFSKFVKHTHSPCWFVEPDLLVFFSCLTHNTFTTHCPRSTCVFTYK